MNVNSLPKARIKGKFPSKKEGIQDRFLRAPSPGELVSCLLHAVGIQDISQIAEENSSFRGFLCGYVAERKFMELLRQTKGVRRVEKIPDQENRKGDFEVETTRGKFTVELKSAAAGSGRNNSQFSVSVKASDACVVNEGSEEPPLRTSCLPYSQFDVLAICLVNITGGWDFLFIENLKLPESKKYPGRISSKITLNLEDPRLKKSILDII